MTPSRDPLKAALAAVNLAREIEADSECVAMLQRADFPVEFVAQELISLEWQTRLPFHISMPWESLPLQAKVAVYLIAKAEIERLS